MAVATGRLARCSLSLSAVAPSVGYESESACDAALKRITSRSLGRTRLVGVARRSRRFGETVDDLTASRIFAVTQNGWKSVHAAWSHGKLEGGRLVERLEGHARGQRALRL